MIARADLLSLTDKLGAAYAQSKTGIGNYPGTGLFSDKADDYLVVVAAVGDPDALIDLLESAQTLRNSASADEIAETLLQNPINQIASHVRDAASGLYMNAIDGVNKFAKHFNVFAPGLAAPTGAATLTPAAGGGGLTASSTYRYALTFYADGSGTVAATETGIGSSEASVVLGSGDGSVALSSIPLGPSGTTGRRIWRTAAGGAAGTERLVKTINDNTTTTYTDVTPDTVIAGAPQIPSPFTCMVSPDFADLFMVVGGLTTWPFDFKVDGKDGQANVFSPAINTGTGMGTFTLGGAGFADSAAVNTDKYAGLNLEAEVTTNITGGTVAPVLTITGKATDGTTGQIWTATFAGVDPTATTKVNATNGSGKRCWDVTTVAINASSGTAGVFRINGKVERTIT